MGTMKKFLRYFILFILMYIVVTFLTNLGMRDNYIDIKYNIETEKPQISITESKATNLRGYIKGSATNNTGEHINSSFLKIDLYNINGKFLGTEYKELKYFNINETINFDIKYRYKEVNEIKLNIVDNKNSI